MNWEFSDIMSVLMLLFLGLVSGMFIGTNLEGNLVEKDAIRNGVGFYSANLETGEVKFYWVGNGTNVEAYKESK
jgi:hypothetical protein